MRIFLTILATAFFISGAHAGVLFEIKGWVGQAYFKKNNQLSFCEAAKRYQGGDRLILLMWKDKSLSLVYETGVRFRKKRKYYSAVYIDKKPLAKGNGIGGARGSLILPFPPTRNIFSSLYNGQSIQITTQATPTKSYSLLGSAAALLKLKQCVDVFSRPPALAAQRQPRKRSKSTRTSQPLPKFKKSQLMVMASRLLNRLQIKGWEFIDPQSAGAKGDIAWKYNAGGFGYMLAYRPEAHVRLEFAAEVMAGVDSKSCKGKLLTVQEPVKTSKDSNRSKNVETICQMGKYALRNSYVIIESKEKSLFIINTETAHKIAPDNPLPQTSDFRPPAGNEL